MMYAARERDFKGPDDLRGPSVSVQRLDYSSGRLPAAVQAKQQSRTDGGTPPHLTSEQTPCSSFAYKQQPSYARNSTDESSALLVIDTADSSDESRCSAAGTLAACCCCCCMSTADDGYGTVDLGETEYCCRCGRCKWPKPRCCNWTMALIILTPLLAVSVWLGVCLNLLYPLQPRMEAIYFRPHTAYPFILQIYDEPVLYANVSGDIIVQSTSRLKADTYSKNVIFQAIFPDWVTIGMMKTPHGHEFKLTPHQSSNVTFWLEAPYIPESVIGELVDEELNFTQKNPILEIGLAGYGEVVVRWLNSRYKIHVDCWFHVNGSVLAENSWLIPTEDTTQSELDYSEEGNAYDGFDQRVSHLDQYERKDLMKNSYNVSQLNEGQMGYPYESLDVGRKHRRIQKLMAYLLNNTYRLWVVQQRCHYALNNYYMFSS